MSVNIFGKLFFLFFLTMLYSHSLLARVENRSDQLWVENCFFEDGDDTLERAYVYWAGKDGGDYVLVNTRSNVTSFDGVTGAENLEYGFDTLCSRDLSSCVNADAMIVPLNGEPRLSLELSWKAFQFFPEEQLYQFSAGAPFNTDVNCDGRRIVGRQCASIINNIRITAKRKGINVPFKYRVKRACY